MTDPTPIDAYYQAVHDIDAACRRIDDTARAATEQHAATVAYWTEIRSSATDWQYDDPDWLNNVSAATNSTLTWAGITQQPPAPPPTPHPPPRSWEELETTKTGFEQQIETHLNEFRAAAQQYQRSRYTTATANTTLWVGAVAATVALLCFGWAVIWMPLTGAFILTRSTVDTSQRRQWVFLYPTAVVVLWLISIVAMITTSKVGVVTAFVVPAGLGAAVTYLAYQKTARSAATVDEPPPMPTHRPSPPAAGHPPVLASRQWGIPGGTVTVIDDGTNTGAVQTGLWGEQQTAVLTTRILAAVPDLWVFHDLTIPNYPGPNVDHVAVRGNHVWLLDSKAWRPAVYVKQHDHMWRDGQPFPAGDTTTMLLAADKYHQMLPAGTVIHPTIVVHPTSNTQISITNHTPNDPVIYITADQLHGLLAAAPGPFPPHPTILDTFLTNTMWPNPTPTQPQ